jgi:DNA polymerase alpha subunit B
MPLTRPTQIFIFSGPYASTKSLHYTAINPIINAIKESKPNLVILMGPFIDTRDPVIGTGSIHVKDSYFSYNNIKIIVQPSPYDVLSFNSMPQQFIRFDTKDNFIFVPNPYLLKLYDFTILLCNCDLPYLVSTHYYTMNGKPDKVNGVEEAASLILSTGMVFPIFPPSEEFPIDIGNWDKLKLAYAPDIMVLPSVQFLHAKVCL